MTGAPQAAHGACDRAPAVCAPAHPIAATLTAGGAAHSNPPGRRGEDDTNLVVLVPAVDPAATLSASTSHGSPRGDGSDSLVVQAPAVDPASALLASAGRHGYSSPRGDGSDPPAVQAFALRGRPGGVAAESHDDGQTTGAVRAASGGASRDYLVAGVGAAVSENQQAVCRLSQVCNSLTAGGGKPGQGYPAALVGPLVLADGVVVCGCGLRVRRLTPRECERLMGLPDDWTLVPLKTRANGRVKTTSDSARYRLCGNAVAVPVVAWIARRLAEADGGHPARGCRGPGPQRPKTGIAR